MPDICTSESLLSLNQALLKKPCITSRISICCLFCKFPQLSNVQNVCLCLNQIPLVNRPCITLLVCFLQVGLNCNTYNLALFNSVYSFFAPFPKFRGSHGPNFQFFSGFVPLFSLSLARYYLCFRLSRKRSRRKNFKFY